MLPLMAKIRLEKKHFGMRDYYFFVNIFFSFVGQVFRAVINFGSTRKWPEDGSHSRNM